MEFTKSLELLHKAKQLIPLATQTFSKGYNYYPLGVAPIFLRHGEGSKVWDVDGNQFIDFVLGLGPITLGYNYPKVNKAIEHQLQEGIIFSLPSSLEVELAEILSKIIPSCEAARFSKNGTDVTNAAVRLARAYTGKPKIAYRGYHGGGNDWYAITTDKSLGVLDILADYIVPFDYNNLDSLRAQFDLNPDQIAAVIMEPIITEAPLPGFLEGVKQLCKYNGALLIFDEVVTGFRMSLGGAQEYFNVIPDIATFGKGIANGMPLNVLVGRKDIMELLEDIFFSYTFAGECLSLAAGLATIQEMKDKRTIEHCWRIGERLVQGLTTLGVKCFGYPCRPMLVLPNDSPYMRSLVIQELVKRGILIHSGMLINLCYSHSEKDIDDALNAFDIVLKLIKENKVELEGEIVQPAFRRL